VLVNFLNTESAMSVLRPRNRLVNFRLSEDEFEKLRSACLESGARSISDFARSAVLTCMERGGPSSSSESRVNHLDRKVSDLEDRIDQLLNLIEATSSTRVSSEVKTGQGASAGGAARASQL
jgi:hypothetical protein